MRGCVEILPYVVSDTTAYRNMADGIVIFLAICVTNPADVLLELCVFVDFSLIFVCSVVDRRSPRPPCVSHGIDTSFRQ